MARFHALTVIAIRRDTRDSVVLTLEPAAQDRAAFAFAHGQYLTFRRDFDGEEVRRSYSICSGCDEGTLRVGVKRVAGGAFSSWVSEELTVGETVEAMRPQGRFTAATDARAGRHYVGFAAGSGITPILSILKTVLAREPRSRFTLVYANRQVGSIMFREELEDVKNVYLGRFSVIHILKAEGQEIDLFTGRIDEEKLAELFQRWIDPAAIDLAFICGPEPLMLTISEALRRHGVADEKIKFELFASAQPGRAVRRQGVAAAATGGATRASVTLDGTTRAFEMDRGVSILDAALANAMDAPYSCRAGVCSTCRGRVLAGEAEMLTNHALEDYEVRAGYILTCQAYPLSDAIAISYDE